MNTLLGLLESVSGGKKRRPLPSDFYNAEQRKAIAAPCEDNNRANRGADGSRGGSGAPPRETQFLTERARW